MSETPPPNSSANEILVMAKALKALRTERNLTQQDAAAVDGMTRQAWQYYEAGHRQAILRSDIQDRLARAVGATRADLLEHRDRIAGRAGPRIVSTTPPDQLQLAMLPVREPARAGAWLHVDDLDQSEPERIPAARDPRFPFAAQWLRPIVGVSMNKLHLFQGDYAHVVDAVAIGYFPKTNDIVEVERLRFDGREREVTIKQVEVVADGVLLWPRSTDERYSEPLSIRDGIDGDEDFEVRISGLVLNSIRRFQI